MNIQNYGTFDYTTLDAIVAGAKMRLQLRDSSNDILLRDLAIDGIKRLRAIQSFVQARAQLPINKTTKTAKLPQGFIRLNKYNGWCFVGADGKVPNTGNFNPPFPSDRPFIGDEPYSSIAPFDTRPAMEISQDGYMHFSSTITAEWVLITYLSQQVDENGDILIPQIYDIFAVPFICWQYNLVIKDYRAAAAWEPQYKNNIEAVRGICNFADAPQMQLTALKMKSLI